MNSIFLQALLLALDLSSSDIAPPRYTAPLPVVQAFKVTHPIPWQRGISMAEDFIKNPRNKPYHPFSFTPETVKSLGDQVTYATMGDITVLNNTTFIYKKKSISLHQGKAIYSGQTIKLISQNLVEPEDNNFYYTRNYSKKTNVYDYGFSYNVSYYDYAYHKNGDGYFNIISDGYTGDKHRAVCYEVGYRFNNYDSWHPSVLVIYTDRTAAAYRFDGYNSGGGGGCKSIRTDGKGTFLVPLIQATKSTPLDHLDNTPHTLKSIHKRLVWYICTMDGCQHYIDPRPVYYGDIQLHVGHVTDWRTVPGTPRFVYDNPPLIGDWSQSMGPFLVDWFNSPICKFASALGILSSVC